MAQKAYHAARDAISASIALRAEHRTVATPGFVGSTVGTVVGIVPGDPARVAVKHTTGGIVKSR
jgi:hypothetical protein